MIFEGFKCLNYLRLSVRFDCLLCIVSPAIIDFFLKFGQLLFITLSFAKNALATIFISINCIYATLFMQLKPIFVGKN